MAGELTVFEFGVMAYRPAVALQERLVRRVGTVEPDAAYLLLGEHDPPVITHGRRRRDEHVLADGDELAAAGIDLCQTRRGGDVTYHGPGQLVAYLILNLRTAGWSVRTFVGKLEETLIDLLEAFGVQGRRIDPLTGVWVGGAKIAAIGTAVRRWVTYHGLALNVGTDLSHFRFIVPCGLPHRPVTSLEALLGRKVPVEQVQGPLAASAARVFGFDSLRRAEPAAFVEAI